MATYKLYKKTSDTAKEEIQIPASSVSGLANVATSGSYNDLLDKPEVPGVPDVVQTTGQSTTAVMSQKAVTDELNTKANSADLAQVATSGSYNDLSNKPNIPTNYVTTDTEQAITGKKTVVTPPDTDDSTQIANTAWVRENYQATCYAGRDSGETGTMYFKVASYSTVADYDHVTLVAHLQDIDSPIFSTVNVHCSTSTKEYAPSAFIGVVDNFTNNASNNPFNHYKDRLFVVANYTIGTQGVTFELWLKTTYKYQQTIFKVISQSSRKGNSKKRPWTLYNNVTTASGTTDFSETSSDGRLVVNNNYLYGATVSYLQPQTDGNIDLGASGKRWNNGYITNLQNCKIINGGGGNSLIQQNSDTSGADITVGSDKCPLKIQGKNARPVYRQGKGSYSNIALQNDIPFNTVGLSTGTLGSTKLPSAGRYYIEFSLETTTELIERSTMVCQVVDFQNKATSTGGFFATQILTSRQYNIYIIFIAANGTITVTKSHHITDITKVLLDDGTNISGTFKYKKLN